MDSKDFLPRLLDISNQLSDDDWNGLIADVKANIASSQKHFVNSYLAAASILAAHFFLSRQKVDSVSVLGNQISQSDGLSTLILTAGAVLLSLSVCSEYALRWYREIYDYGSTIKNRLLSRSGFHDFRVNVYNLSGIEILMHHGPKISRLVGVFYRLVTVFLLFTLPTGYLLTESYNAIIVLNTGENLLELVLLLFSFIVSILNFVVVGGSMQIANVDRLIVNKKESGTK